jgi:hypothetical protein
MKTMPETRRQPIFSSRAREAMMVLKPHFLWAYSALFAAPVD